jgi:hypothetical protein
MIAKPTLLSMLGPAGSSPTWRTGAENTTGEPTWMPASRTA